jgi:hypothetical protein
MFDYVHERVEKEEKDSNDNEIVEAPSEPEDEDE